MAGPCRAFAAGGNRARHLVKVEVESLLAAHTDKGIDPRLGPITRGRLRQVFDYTSYVLLKQEKAAVGCGQAVAFNLPQGRILHVNPISIEGNMIALELVLFEGAHSVMRTDIKMINAGAIMIVGPRFPGQTYITTIEANEAGASDRDDSSDSGGSIGYGEPSGSPTVRTGAHSQ
jgi:hypothetical protein